jgi:L-seryl-tRNA(Ser) seleniumtransferase
MKRALRVDKIRLAALEATLRLYRDPDTLREQLPTLRRLTRPEVEIRAQAIRLQPEVARRLGEGVEVGVVACGSQIGSGALPLETLPSAGLALRPADGRGRSLEALASGLRDLPVPVVGHMTDGQLVLDLRCLEDDARLLAALAAWTGASA